jgi:hypothetical protein
MAIVKPKKYVGLTSHLSSLDTPHWTAQFSEIEEKVGCALPRSARTYPAWWSNQRGPGHSQSAAWQSIGWLTCDLDLANQRVTFVRREQAADEEQAVSPTSRMNQKHALTIAEAKAGLSATFGVPPDAIEITIRG